MLTYFFCHMHKIYWFDSFLFIHSFYTTGCNNEHQHAVVCHSEYIVLLFTYYIHQPQPELQTTLSSQKILMHQVHHQVYIDTQQIISVYIVHQFTASLVYKLASTLYIKKGSKTAKIKCYKCMNICASTFKSANCQL